MGNQGGDPACWLDQVCDECGAVIEDKTDHQCHLDAQAVRQRLATLKDARNAYVTTIGRHTGRGHEIEIWFATGRHDRIGVVWRRRSRRLGTEPARPPRDPCRRGGLGYDAAANPIE
jgi:hypothetical protein